MHAMQLERIKYHPHLSPLSISLSPLFGELLSNLSYWVWYFSFIRISFFALRAQKTKYKRR